MDDQEIRLPRFGFETPIGLLGLEVETRVTGGGRPRLVGVRFGADPDDYPLPAEDRALSEPAREVRRRLAAYFSGTLRDFDLEPVFRRGTDFERRVWRATTGIPYGETATYGDLARDLGSVGAERAVGRALAANPIPVVIPCHRVVGADGSLVGFGGGKVRKRWLLDHEAGYRRLF